MLHGNFIARDDSPIAITEHVAAGASDNHIVVPDAQLLFHADFKRIGDDLKLVGQDGKAFLIADYFKHDIRATLVAPDGAGLSADVIEALAGPRAAGQYAQATAAAQAAEVVGKVVSQSGSVQIVRNGVAISVNTGDTVLKGDVVQTGDGGALSIIFTDSSTFNLSANARMVINEFVYDPNGSANASLVNLVQGTIGFVAGQVAKTGDMKVKTPVATMGIRGTAVVVEISSDNGTTKFSVVQEPNGVVGSYNLYNNTTGALIGTVSNSTIGWVVRPVSPTDVFAQQLTKSAEEVQKELAFIQAVFQNMSIGQQLLSTDPNNTKTQTAFTQFIVSDRLGINPGDPYGPPKTTTVNFNGGTQNNYATPPIDVPGFINHPPIARPDGEINHVASVTEAGVQPGGNFPFTDTPSVSGDLIANDSDPDNDALTMIDITADGPAHGTLVADSSGNFTYTLNNNDPAVQALALGDTMIVTYTYVIRDIYGATATSKLTITIVGTNDQPVVISASITADISEAPVTAPVVSHEAHGTITFDDVDFTDGHYPNIPVASFEWTTTATNAVLDTAALNAAIDFDLTFVDSTGAATGSVTWDFSITDAALNFLANGETLTITYPITVTDDYGASVTRDVVITIHGANDKPVIGSDIRQHPDETTVDQDITATIPVSFTDADLNDTGHTLTILSAAATGTTAGLALDPDGLRALATVTSITKAEGSTSGAASIAFVASSTAFDYLAAGESVVITYTIEINDGDLGTAQQTRSVEIHGTNDAPAIAVLSGDSIAATIPETNAGLSSSGTLSVSDVDLSNTVSASVQGVVVGGNGAGAVPGSLTDAMLKAMLTVNAGNVIGNTATTGTITWNFNSGTQAFDFLAYGKSLELTYTIRATDGSASDNQTVTITITGSNDAPVITGATNPIAQTEATSASAQDIPAISGTLSVTDLDVGNSLTGVVTVDGVAKLNGSTTLPSGVNVSALIDAAAISFDTVTTDGGTKVLTWTYDPAAADLDWLRLTDVLTIEFTAMVGDGFGSAGNQTVTITILGSNDTPTVTGLANPVTISEATNALLQNIAPISGTLSVRDLDVGDSLSGTVSVNGVAKLNGSTTLPSGVNVSALIDAAAISFNTVTTDGGTKTLTWTYDPAAANLDWLAATDSLTIEFVVNVDDGYGPVGNQTVTITITGTNDAPIVSASNDFTPITEDETANAGQTVADLLNVTDADAGALQGIAVIGSTNAAGGHWEYKLVSGSWTAFAPSATTALLLTTLDSLRFVPDAINGGTGTLTYRAWDQTDGLSAGTTVNVTATNATGDTTAYSSNTATASITVTPVNDAPVAVSETANASVAGFTYNPANGHWYKVNTAESSWAAAQAAAVAAGGYLATITDANENTFVANLIQNAGKYYAWLGGNDAATEGQFVWASGPENGNPVGYINWESGEPNDGAGAGEDYIYMRRSADGGLWNDYAGDGSGAPNHDPLPSVIEVGFVEDKDSIIPAAFLLANDTDVENQLLSINGLGSGNSTSAATTGGGTVTLLPNGNILYTPATNFKGADSFAYWIKDASGGVSASSATFGFTVESVNDAPVIAGLGNSSIAENAVGALIDTFTVSDVDTASGLTFRVLDTSSIVDPRFTVVAASGTTFGQPGTYELHLASGQSLDYETEPSVSLTVEVNDNTGINALATASLVVTVTDVPEGPATFTGTSGSDVANATTGILTGFTGGVLAQLQDAIGDTFILNNGADTVVAGAGNDTFYMTQSNSGSSLNGALGTDTLNIGGVNQDLHGMTLTSVENLVTDGSNADQFVTMTLAQYLSFSSFDLGAGTNDRMNAGLAAGQTADLSALALPTLLGVEKLKFVAEGFGDQSLTLTAAQLAGVAEINFAQGNIVPDNDTVIIKTSANFDMSASATAINDIENIVIRDDNNGHTLVGSVKAEIFEGQGGNDVMTGGGGADKFVFDPGFGQDTVTDFSATTDYLQFDDAVFGNVAALLAAAADVSGNAVITFDAGNTVTLTGVTVQQLQDNQSHLLIA